VKEFFKYELKSPISVSVDGKEQEGSNLIVKCPCPKDRVNQAILESLCGSAIDAFGVKINRQPKEDSNKNKNREEDDDDTPLDPTFMGHVIVTNIDTKEIQHLFNVLCELLNAKYKGEPQCTLEDQRLTVPLFDELKLEDLKEILGRYFCDFLSIT